MIESTILRARYVVSSFSDCFEPHDILTIGNDIFFNSKRWNIERMVYIQRVKRTLNRYIHRNIECIGLYAIRIFKSPLPHLSCYFDRNRIFRHSQFRQVTLPSHIKYSHKEHQWNNSPSYFQRNISFNIRRMWVFLAAVSYNKVHHGNQQSHEYQQGYTDDRQERRIDIVRKRR